MSVVKKGLYTYAIGFGLGLSPIMPGTCGSLLAPILAFGLYTDPYRFIYVAILLILAFFAAEEAGKQLKNHDHKSIVCDEIIGLLPVLLLLPYEKWLLAFVLFRVLDILKPWPISWVDRTVGGAAGCLLDDILAGIFTWLAIVIVVNH